MENFDDLFTSVPERPQRQKESDFDAEVWAAKKKEERETVYGMIDEALTVMSSEGAVFQTYLDVQARFDRYTTNNAILIAAQMPDATGRVFLFERNAKCEVQPVLQIAFTLPEVLPVMDKLDFRTSGNNILPVDWTLEKDGQPVNLEDYLSGRLNAYSGKVSFAEYGAYTFTATMTDVLGRSFTYTDGLYVYPIATYEYGSFVSGGYYGLDGPTVKVCAVDEWGMVSEWAERKVPVSIAPPTVTLESPTLGVGTTTDLHEVEFHAMVTSEARYTLSTVDYFDRSTSATTTDIPETTSDNLINGNYEDGRHILVARVTDIFARSSYVTRYFIVGPDQDSASSDLTDLNTTLQNEGLYDNGDPIVYINSFVLSVPAISGHSTGCKDIVTITGILSDGTEEIVLTFNTNNGYVYASSDGTYEYTKSGSKIVEETWNGWEPERYVKLQFNYEMLAGHEECLTRATEGMRYTVGYSFILDDPADIDKLFK